MQREPNANARSNERVVASDGVAGLQLFVRYLASSKELEGLGRGLENEVDSAREDDVLAVEREEPLDDERVDSGAMARPALDHSPTRERQ